MVNKKLDKWIENSVVQNLVFWILFVILASFIIHPGSGSKLTAALYFTLFIIPPIYINNLWVLPFFNAKNYGSGIFYFLINLVVFGLLGVYLLHSGVNSISRDNILSLFTGMLLVLLIASVAKIAKNSIERKKNYRETELQMLKNQLNPHFFFNTLNNLYGLSVVKSDDLPGLMLKLSDLLRYSLYETGDQLVPLDKEINYIKNYVELERIRLSNTARIELEIEGEFSEVGIAPMLLIVFVENAFKHFSVNDDGENYIRISFHQKDEGLIFECHNSKSTIVQNGRSGGIGLKNVKKRLELIYGANYRLRTDNKEGCFSVHLSIKL